MKLLPEGLAELLAPAAALPALLLTLVPEDPAVMRQGEVLESQLLSRLAEPPFASAAVPVSASAIAIANPIAANFITVRLSRVADFCVVLRTKKSEKTAARPGVPTHFITIVSDWVIVEFAFEPRSSFDRRGRLLAPLRHARLSLEGSFTGGRQ
jgi:hypothetical protein